MERVKSLATLLTYKQALFPLLVIAKTLSYIGISMVVILGNMVLIGLYILGPLLIPFVALVYDYVPTEDGEEEND
jgi:hypothetical protein